MDLLIRYSIIDADKRLDAIWVSRAISCHGQKEESWHIWGLIDRKDDIYAKSEVTDLIGGSLLDLL